METRTYEIRGLAPTIMHNAQLSDPLNEWARSLREITSKRKKTDADHEELARREFMGGLYLVGPDLVPGYPASNLERLLLDGAKHQKLGKVVQSSLLVLDDVPLIYNGPKDPDELWAAGGFSIRASVKNGTNRVIRTRPCFPVWSLKFSAQYDETRLNPGQVDEFLETAGKLVGLGDWRPKHGRFEVVSAS